jgi:hypothetical protein
MSSVPPGVSSAATVTAQAVAPNAKKATNTFIPAGHRCDMERFYNDREKNEFADRAFHLSIARATGNSALAPKEVRAAWEDHGKTDSYPTMPEVRALCAEILPGARVRQHLLWRYSIVWRKVRR